MNSHDIATVVVTTMLTQKGPDESLSLQCGACDQTTEIWDSQDQPEMIALVKNLIEHAQYDHVSFGGISLVRTTDLLSAYELSRMLGRPAVNEYEEKWRAAHPLVLDC